MTHLNFRVNPGPFDDPDQERDSLSTWLRALAIAVLAIGAMVVGALLNDSNAIEYLGTIAIHW